MRTWLIGLCLLLVLSLAHASVSSSSTYFAKTPYLSTFELYDNNEPSVDIDIFAAPSRSLASLFLHVKQQQIVYLLLIEFLPENWSASLYKQLVDSGASQIWFLQSKGQSQKSRLNGWKDSNLLYNTGIISSI